MFLLDGIFGVINRVYQKTKLKQEVLNELLDFIDSEYSSYVDTWITRRTRRNTPKVNCFDCVHSEPIVTASKYFCKLKDECFDDDDKIDNATDCDCFMIDSEDGESF